MLILYGFLAFASLVLVAVVKKLPKDKQKKLAVRLGNKNITDDIRKTEPSGDAVLSGTKFVMHKLTLLLLVVCVGSFLSFIYELKQLNSKELMNGSFIRRNGYEGDAKNIRLRVRNRDTDEADIIDVSVSERRYTDEELDIMSTDVEEHIFRTVIGDNSSLDRICTDMHFPATIEGYPFKLSWRTDDPLLLNNKGMIDKERLKRLDEKMDIYEGVLTGIHVMLIYEDYLKEVDFYARIYPLDANNEYSLAEYVNELIREEDKATRTEEYLKLPETAGETGVKYEEAGDNRAAVLFVMTLILAAGLYYREDRELKNRVKGRDKQLISDYPGMINKFVLFYSAGLTTRGIWSKLCKDYRGRLNNGEEKRYLYEEMLICEGRMNEGLGEQKAYEGFAARCGLRRYRQFISLVEQAINKGRADLLPLLEREAGDAFAERKNRAKELGEEAGTKLLFPMLMMLFVVLIIVMVPAFIAFRM